MMKWDLNSPSWEDATSQMAELTSSCCLILQVELRAFKTDAS